MGMFDKDKEIGLALTSQVAAGQDFILRGIAVDDEKVKTDLGDATKTRLQVSYLEQPDVVEEWTTLASPIAERAQEAEASDFPAVVCWTKVKSNYGNDATVLRFKRPWSDDGSTAQQSFADQQSAAKRQNAAAETDTPPF